MARPLRSLVVFALAVVASSAATACGSTCDRGQKNVQDFTDGITDGNEYQSSARAGPYVPFRSGDRIRFVHGLTNPPTPGTVDVLIGFDETGDLAPAAGNHAVIESVDGEAIVVENDTCANVFVYVHAEGSTLPDG